VAVKTIYIVETGSYDDTLVVRAFEDRQDAERYALELNSKRPWTNPEDRARVEELGFVPTRGE
jgi:hypothetical protein